MKIYFRLLIIFALLPLFSTAQKLKSQRFYHLIIGTYTKTQDKGLFAYKFDSQTGKLSFESNSEGIKNPSYLAITEDGKNIYTVNESGTDRKGGVSAFNFDAKSGKITFINQEETIGAGPCYLSIAPDGKFVFTANYTGGSVSVLPIQKDKSVGKLKQLIQHEGSSIDKSRQKEPHAHSAIFSPDGSTLFSADLGTDKLYAYNYDSSFSKPLQDAAQPFVTITPGFGPRHFVFNKNADKVYLLSEMSAEVTVFEYKDKVLHTIQNISLNNEDFKGTNGAADIHLSNDGKFLYATNRGSVNEIVIFKVDAESGELSKVGSESSKGKAPRNFIIDPTDQFLLVANQNSDDIYVFKRDKETGLLSYTGEKVAIGSPVCLKMTPVK
ncbi:MAG: lactonase family protein [Pelobium sp.]